MPRRVLKLNREHCIARAIWYQENGRAYVTIAIEFMRVGDLNNAILFQRYAAEDHNLASFYLTKLLED